VTGRILPEEEIKTARLSRNGANQAIRIPREFELPGLFSFESAAVQRYANLRYYLEEQGTSIGPNDMLIAAHALALNCTLVTANEAEFRQVPGLRVENWTKTRQV
jgi:tRNA(fMet)-specific endonuclease VapC